MNLAYGPLNVRYTKWPIKGHDLCSYVQNCWHCILNGVVLEMQIHRKFTDALVAFTIWAMLHFTYGP